MKNNWKTAAIILIVILVLENLLIGYGMYLNKKDTEKTMICYYNICKDYADAYFDINTNVCSCYNYDVLGNINYDKSVRSEYLG